MVQRLTQLKAARAFKVPVGTIRNVWPRLPFCKVDRVLRKRLPALNIKGQPAPEPVVRADFDPADILTPEQLAQRLQVRPEYIYEKVRPRCSNPIPVMRIGRYLRFSWTDVCRWMKTTQRN